MSEISELLERFRRGGDVVAMSMMGAAGPELDFVSEPGKWCVRQIVCHLADSEVVGAMRFRQLIAEDNPVIQWYDEGAWATRLDYARRKPSHAIETFRRTRSENFDLLTGVPEEDFNRPGTHSKLGPVTLLSVLKMYAEHAENHVVQLRGVRAAYKEARTQKA